ncbi:hypothetical protein ACV35P_32630, partial [Pseudomonas aeruginosa]
IGVSVIKVGSTDLGGGGGATDFGVPAKLALGALVRLSIVLLSRSRLPQVGHLGDNAYYPQGCRGDGWTYAHVTGKGLAEALRG